MPRKPRLSFVLLVSFLATVLAFPAMSVGCAQGDPTAAAPMVEPATTQAPTEPTAPPAPTQEKPKPANPDDALPPEVTSVTPDKAAVGTVGPSIVVAGNNFGMGSSREQAAVIIKLSGARAVLAKSFARIFFRNSINNGLPCIEVDTTGINEGDELSIDFDKGILRDHTNGIERHFEPLPPIMTRILDDGGLIAHLQKHGDFAM